MRHGGLSLQAPAAVADVLYATWRSARGAAVTLLYRMAECEAPLARRCVEAYP